MILELAEEILDKMIAKFSHWPETAWSRVYWIVIIYSHVGLHGECIPQIMIFRQ